MFFHPSSCVYRQPYSYRSPPSYLYISHVYARYHNAPHRAHQQHFPCTHEIGWDLVHAACAHKMYEKRACCERIGTGWLVSGNPFWRAPRSSLYLYRVKVYTRMCNIDTQRTHVTCTNKKPHNASHISVHDIRHAHKRMLCVTQKNRQRASALHSRLLRRSSPASAIPAHSNTIGMTVVVDLLPPPLLLLLQPRAWFSVHCCMR